MGVMASPINSLAIVYSTVYSGVDQIKHQSSASLVFVWGIHWWPWNSQHKWPVTRKMFPFDDVIMSTLLNGHTCDWLASQGFFSTTEPKLSKLDCLTSFLYFFLFLIYVFHWAILDLLRFLNWAAILGAITLKTIWKSFQTLEFYVWARPQRSLTSCSHLIYEHAHKSLGWFLLTKACLAASNKPLP